MMKRDQMAAPHLRIRIREGQKHDDQFHLYIEDGEVIAVVLQRKRHPRVSKCNAQDGLEKVKYRVSGVGATTIVVLPGTGRPYMKEPKLLLNEYKEQNLRIVEPANVEGGKKGKKWKLDPPKWLATFVHKAGAAYVAGFSRGAFWIGLLVAGLCDVGAIMLDEKEASEQRCARELKGHVSLLGEGKTLVIPAGWWWCAVCTQPSVTLQHDYWGFDNRLGFVDTLWAPFESKQTSVDARNSMRPAFSELRETIAADDGRRTLEDYVVVDGGR
ncbi:hypothetical protein AK812_SmicGene35116 [Symbiodinium microadriaticum]|uniref:Uncharacterized protein n=1 Tax=Symbiodinium microadriaticum TaxID=2951 RepID=A0A1Q9CM96_SYMMI|nr:hypothetical protein AK812_SmicGene35116 [Symbiodinium microadriaticum]